MDLFEDNTPSNTPPLSVSELSGAVKRVIEGEFGRVRVRGEVGRVSRPASGHLYFDLKDDRAVLAAICWKAVAARLTHRPEEGMEVIVTGRLTTYPGQSRYQLQVESIEPAGIGALMAMLEQRRKALAAEGLFDAARKRPLPSLPRVIGVVTSPSGAVIRDILHRLRDRFPTHVLIWPVAVQGTACAPEVAAAIAGFNALPEGGPIPRPDLIIVARGGGSIEDLWGFNDEAVVRAAAASAIPLISAVGHETDTTLIDHASDLRAPTPTAAAELAVPVRAELTARLAESHARILRAMQGRATSQKQRLRDLSRALGRPQALTEAARQRHDLTAERLEPALRGFVRARRAALNALPLPPALLRQGISAARRRLGQAERLDTALQRRAADARAARDRLAARLQPAGERLLRDRRRDLDGLRRRLESGLAHLRGTAQRRNTEQRARLDALSQRLAAAPGRRLKLANERLDRLDRLRQTLGYHETLRRGFAVVRDKDRLVADAATARGAARLEIEFHDGKVKVRPEDGRQPGSTRGKPPGDQGSLF